MTIGKKLKTSPIGMETDCITHRRVSGEPGGTLAMVACEPGQGGNTAAINIAIMCLGAPPRLTRNLSGNG